MRSAYKTLALALALAASLTALAGCAGGSADADPYVDRVTLEEVVLEPEAVALSESPAAAGTLLLPTASGIKTAKNDKAVIDYSHTQDGYVMARYTAKSDKKLKVKITGPSGSDKAYTYNLPQGEWTTFPLSDGSGAYTVKVLENVADNKYAVVATAAFQADLTDQFAPFLRPNQYVNYEGAANTIAKAAELTAGLTDPLQKVEAVYAYVVNTLTYDKDRAASVTSGYLPELDSVLSEEKGICFDYAALMAGMLRSQGVPCKLVVGYAGKQYHAWISVYTDETGWVEGVVYFDGASWQRMDPTFASSSKGSEAVQKYIGDGSNYTEKYLY